MVRPRGGSAGPLRKEVGWRPPFWGFPRHKTDSQTHGHTAADPSSQNYPQIYMGHILCVSPALGHTKSRRPAHISGLPKLGTWSFSTLSPTFKVLADARSPLCSRSPWGHPGSLGRPSEAPERRPIRGKTLLRESVT